MHRIYKKPASVLPALVLVLALVIPAFAQYRITVPSGTVIPLRMETQLSSESSRVGDRFTATVFRDVFVNGRTVIPAGAKVEGHVTGSTRARRGGEAGTIAVAFDRLIFPNGNSIPIDGTLTTLSEEGRRELENIDNEDRVEGGSRTRRAVVFIGGGAGAGAVIGAIAGGGKGAAVGAGVGAVLGTIGVLMTRGDSAEVRPGTEFGMMVERDFTIETDRSGVASDRDVRDPSYNEPQTSQRSVYTSLEAIRSAQMSLRDRGYYTGPINGQMNIATREAIRAFQRDNRIAVTGELNFRTAQELGIADQSGLETSAIEITNARAERVGNDSIRVSLDVRTQTGGWNIFVNRFVQGNTLQVNVRGVPPRYSSTQAVEVRTLNETFTGMGNVSRVIVHGPQRDITIDLSGNTGGGNTGGGGGIDVIDARQVALLASRLVQSYQRDLNIRTARGQVTFDSNRNLRANEVDLLLQLHSLRAAAELYGQLVAGGVNDPEALKGAADSLARQLRFTNRIMNRSGIQLTGITRNDWDLLRAQFRNLTFNENDNER